MTCFETGWAVLLKLSYWKDLTTILTPFIAIVGVIYAARQIYISKQEARRSTAFAVYNDYLKMCMDKPYYARGILVNDPNYNDEYKWFASRMLFTFEQIIETCNQKTDSSWNTTISNQLRRHKSHLEVSGTVSRKEWGATLLKLIDEATSS
jgi:hypothetical protein